MRTESLISTIYFIGRKLIISGTAVAYKTAVSEYLKKAEKIIDPNGLAMWMYILYSIGCKQQPKLL